MDARLGQAARHTIALLVTAGLFASAVFAASSPRPNLKVSALTVSPGSVVGGGKVSVTDTTANSGSKLAGKSTTAFFLSTDARKDARDRQLGSHAVAALKPRKSAKKTTSLAVPAAQAAGSYRVIACADSAGKVRESKEGDNCRVAPTALTVTAPSPAVPTTPVSPTLTTIDTVSPANTTTPPTDTTPPPTGPTPSEQIATLRDAPDGSVNTTVAGVTVTYVKPSVSGDGAGFYVQAAQAGPALFVAVDPSTLNPVPAVGDKVGFTATQMATVSGRRQVSALSSFSRSATGENVAALKQNLSASTDLISGLGSYESELLTLSGTIATNFSPAGIGYESAQLATSGVSGTPNLQLRLPATVRAGLGLANACTITINNGVMGRSAAVAQPTVYGLSDITPTDCPGPTVTSAIGGSSTTVTVTFSRALNPATVSPDGSQFTADNGLTFSAAAVGGPNNTTVTLTSSTQTQGVGYTVSVANTVKDAFGFGVDMPNSAMFTGATPAAIIKLNEINPTITGAHDLIELKVTTGGTTGGIAINEVGSSTIQLAVLPAISVATGDLIVVHLTPSGTTGIAPASETNAKNEYPSAAYSANYDGAWDVLGNATGLTNSNRILRVVAASSATIDAVPVVLSTSGSPPVAFPSNLQTLQAEGLWLPADCGGSPCTYASTPTAVAISVDYLSTGTTPAGQSVSRKSGMFTKQASDWNAAAANTFGADNP